MICKNKIKYFLITTLLTFVFITESYASSNIDATFENLYPVPFYKTTTGKWVIGSVAAIGVTAATIATGGAAAVPGATWIGSMLGTTWTAGLATLGGGTLAAGGFGMAGGAMVIGVTTDLALMGVSEFLPTSKYNGKYSKRKIPLPSVGSSKVLDIYEKIDDLKEDRQDKKLSQAEFNRLSTELLKIALNKIDPKNNYDLINKAILEFNLGKFDESYLSINEAEKHSDKKSYLYYHKALLELTINEENWKLPVRFLQKSIKEENDALEPYLLLIEVYEDHRQYDKALNVAKIGLENYDDDSYELNSLAGEILYKKGNYKEAINYYKEALSNMTINELEAELKVNIANCYYSMVNVDYSKAKEWYEDALSEVDDKPYKEVIKKMYIGAK